MMLTKSEAGTLTLFGTLVHFGTLIYFGTLVLTSDVDLAPPKHSYMFCQMVSPVVGHDGGPCTCYDVGK